MNPNPDFSNINSPTTVQNIQNLDAASSSCLPHSQSQACASCKHQRRRCTLDCPLAPYFPAHEQARFLAVHRLYGVRNVLKILNKLDPLHHADAMRTIIYESEMWVRNPATGCYGLILELAGYHQHLIREFALTSQQLEICRAQPVIRGGGDGQHADYFSFDGNDDMNSLDIGVGFGNANEIGIGNENGFRPFGNQYEVGSSSDYNGNSVDFSFLNLKLEEDKNSSVMLNEDADQITPSPSVVANADGGSGSGKGIDFDHDATGSRTYHYSSGEARNGNLNSMGQMNIQEHDLKGAASLFTLKSKDNSYL